MSALGRITILVFNRVSISAMAVRFSLSKNVPTVTGTTALISALRSFFASSSIMRRMDRERDLVLRIVPCPEHRGQTLEDVSSRDGRKRWRDISSRPKRDIRPICTRALSMLSASFILFSTSRWLRTGCMSIKSITIKPPISLRRIWRAISSAASRLVASAVSSMFAPLVALDELMSILTRASVGSITIEPPEGSLTSRSKAVSIWPSIW